MTARDEILARIHHALADRPAAPGIPRTYRATGQHAPGADALVTMLTERVTDYRARLYRATSAEVPSSVAAALGEAGSHRVIVPSGFPDRWLPTGIEPVPDTGCGAAELDRFDAVLTGCAVAIADTGTLVLDGGIDQGRRAISLVPDHHVCCVTAERIVGTVPEALAELDPARPLTFISGPSATSDIELERVEGVHGPRRLDVIVVEAGGG
ncbi:lactate utilization protein C [Haloechinothrix sp. LS1_15]|uniref:LutC/YkgG family protein n=1 Tax=Haloechinothrix sp. LS1_15 TaxID=2652248 RepID=UPI0029445AEC|nr:lactate utilization protein C [Haloechinothrix sp. LS1_15]MDV6013671.1 lactate utilization protein C [Haloechinothrix sp. LS1_15]